MFEPELATSPRLFLVHAPQDTWFAEGFLLPALLLPQREVLISTQLELGSSIVNAIGRGALSPLTVVVISAAFLASPWAQFANQLAAHRSIEVSNENSMLVPALLGDCEVPLLSRFLVSLDFRDRARDQWEAQVSKLRAKLAAQAPEVAQIPCPYPGIRSFTAEDESRFYGREQEIRELLGRLRDGQRELYVIGPSGSGKSSLVAAGMVPSLQRRPELAGSSFLVRTMRPGTDPIAALAAVFGVSAPPCAMASALRDAVSRLLARHAEHDRLLIFVDQLEELFTTAEPQAREAFIAAIRELREDERVGLVLTLRADFYLSLLESALWRGLERQISRLEVTPLQGARLRLAIEAPARALGVHFEPVLVERLLHDVAGEPGALPLLQDTLLDLWHQRTRGLLRLTEYQAMRHGTRSGLAAAIARRANSALSDLSPGQREIARRVLLRLVHFGDGATPTRRQQRRVALATAHDAPAEIDAVIRHLADHRLVTTSGGDDRSAAARVDLAHEVLLWAWPALGEWIRAHKEDEQRRRVLEAKATEWANRGRGQARLLDADELREIRGWLTDGKARELGLSEEIHGLLAASEAALAAQATEVKKHRQRWQRWVMVGLLAFNAALVAVSSLASMVVRSFRETGEQAKEAREHRARNFTSQGQAHLMKGEPQQAAPFFAASRSSGDESVSLHMLFSWAAKGLPLVQIFHGDVVIAVAWSPDGRRVATVSYDHTARVWDVASGYAVTPPLQHQGWVTAVVWSPDGKHIATASHDRTAQVWNATSGQPMTPSLRHHAPVTAVAWSPDGKRLATASDDHTARVWDVSDKQMVALTLTHEEPVTAVVWSPDGKRLATASDDHTARVWDAASGAPVVSLVHQEGVTAVAWSPDGTRVATASYDRTALVWEVATGDRVTELMHRGWISMVTWSPDGTRVATASGDGTAQVWNAVSGLRVTPALVHEEWVTAVVWSPDGTRVATASWDKSARIWDAASGLPVTPPLWHLAGITAVAWSPDGTRVATASGDKITRVWSADSGLLVTPPFTHEGLVTAVAWSPDETQIATMDASKTVRVLDAATGQPIMTPITHASWITTAAWNRDETQPTTASWDKLVQKWKTTAGQRMTPATAHWQRITAVAWSPDRTRVATASWDKTARVWDARSGQPVTPLLPHESGITTMAWSPDGMRVATWSSDKIARVWDARSGLMVMLPLTHQAGVTMAAWSPNGTRLVTVSSDRTTRVWTLSWDTGTLLDWYTTLERCDYHVNREGILVPRDPTATSRLPPDRADHLEAPPSDGRRPL